MGALHKISGDFYDDDFVLVALHSSLEDHAMVYGINKRLKTKFVRATYDLDLSTAISFPLFEWEDELNDRYWTFMANGQMQQRRMETVGLFKDQVSSTTHHLIPEYKDVDYFMKIEADDTHMIDTIIRQVLEIPAVQTAYSIRGASLKSIKNIIF